MEALARELEALRRQAVSAAGPEPLVVGGVELDEARHELRCGGRPVHITHGEFRLLRLLLGHPGRVFERKALLREVCGLDNPGQSRNVDAHVHRLRHKLGEAGERLQVVHGVGYRWNTEAKCQ